MKNWLKVLFAVMLVVTCLFSYVACNNNSETPDGDGNDPDTNQTPNDKNEETEDPDDPEFMEDAWQIKFHYSYTAQVVNDNDRTQNKQADVTIAIISVPYDEAADGWTDELLAKKDAITYHGYKFESWYPAWNEETQTGWDKDAKPQVPVGDPYDFSTATIDGDIHLYAFKGDVAGDDIVWDVALGYETDAAIVPEDIPDDSVVVNFVNVGWDSELRKNVTNTVALSALVVDKNTGWTQELKDTVNAIRYDGYALTWYSDWDMDTMTAVGDAYAFPETLDETVPDTITLYGVLGERDESFEETSKSLVSGVLSLNGSGEMYNFNDANTIDVPWYDYKDSIISIVMDDDITYIGKNSFANFGSLKYITFGDSLETIGENAFYSCNNSAFRTLRLPDSVKYIGKSAFANTKLREVILNNGLETIGESAFSGSSSISSVVVPTTLKKVETGAFFAGSRNGTHALAKGKVYFMGESAADFNKIEIGLDNENFKEFAAVYCYKEKTDNMGELDGLYWYFYNVDSVDYPAQYSYALKYYAGTSKIPVFTDYVPVAPKLVPVYEQKVDDDGNLVFETDGVTPVYVQATDEEGNLKYVQEFDENSGMPVFEGAITAQNMINYNLIKNAEKILADDGTEICNLGYGFMDITGIKDIAEDVLINGDKELTCVRAVYSSDTNSGILGGGIKWELDVSTGTLNVYPGTDEGDTNKMWNLFKTSDADIVWYNSSLKVPNVKKIFIHDGVLSIGNYVFAGTGIKEIVIPASVTEIAPEAFVNCSNLTYIYYEGSSLDAFNYEKKDNDGNVLLDNEQNPVIGNYAAELDLANANVYAKTETGVATDGAYWLEYTTETDDKKVKVAWILNSTDDGTSLTIGGDDEMNDFAFASDAPWYGAKDKITSVTVARNIVSLAKNLVSGYSNVKDVSLPTSLRTIPESALEGTYIVNQTPDYDHGLLIIDGHLIKVDPAIRNVAASEDAPVVFVTTTNIVNIADGAFSRCGNIKILFISNTVQYINPNAFDDVNPSAIFIDNTAGTWANIAKDFDYERIPVFYRSQYYINENGEYVATTCNHVFEEGEEAWKVTEEATCLEKGSKERYCIFGYLDDGSYDQTHYVDKAEIPVNLEAHDYEQKIDEKYLVEDSTEDDLSYYESCSICGKKSDTTFKPQTSDDNQEGTDQSTT